MKRQFLRALLTGDRVASPILFVESLSRTTFSCCLLASVLTVRGRPLCSPGLAAEFKFRTVPVSDNFFSIFLIALKDGILALGNSAEKSALNWGRKDFFLFGVLLLWNSSTSHVRWGWSNCTLGGIATNETRSKGHLSFRP